jgi:hypothetical protein
LLITAERNGGPNYTDELYSIYPNGRIVGDNGTTKIERQVTSADVDKLLSDINDIGWFTDEFYDTWHTPCAYCFGYYLTVAYKGQEKTVKAVNRGTDGPAGYDSPSWPPGRGDGSKLTRRAGSSPSSGRQDAGKVK